MNFATENRVDPENQTQCAGLSPMFENSHSTIEYLVAVRQNRQLVKVFRPQEKNITFGRSSQCSITLSDPRFSRKAGEIVLGPVPIMRRYGNGEENSEIIPINPGKAYRIRPYTLTLMESGDVIFNRNKKNNKRETGFLKYVLFIIATLGAGSMIFLHQGMTDMVADPEQGSASFSVVTEQNRDEITVKAETKESKESDDTIEIQMLAPSEPLAEKQIIVSETTSNTSTPTLRRKEGVAPVIRHRAEKKSRRMTIHNDELDKAIKSAALLIEQGNLKLAGRTLNPLLPHVDDDQRKIIIETLDPPAEALFKKAYMLKPYEPGRSKEILQGIVESGLQILPSYGKAKRVLEGELGTVIGNR
jgi:hypothetical protein